MTFSNPLSLAVLALVCTGLPLAARPVPELPAAGEKVRVIIDTDAANEIDDLYALALVLVMPERFEIEGIVAAHYGDFGGPEGIEASFDLIEEMLKLAGREDVPVFKGSDPFQYARRIEESAGVDFIVKEAMDEGDERPLWVVSLGACTNISMAYLKEPEIADRVISLWHGRTQWPLRCWNFNAWNDLRAVQVMFESELPLVLFDTGGYTRASMEETEERIAPHGKLGAYLHGYREKKKWYQDEKKGFFDLGDIAVLADRGLCDSEINDVPEVDRDFTYKHTSRHGKMLRIYQIDDAAVWRLLSEKLEIFAKTRND